MKGNEKRGKRMTNRELEEKLRRAAGKVTPDVMDRVYERIEAGRENDAIVPMDLSGRKHRRVSVWIPLLASAAALMLVLNVGMFIYYHGGKGGDVVQLDPAGHSGVSEGGALLIDRIVEIDPEYTPEELAAYSIDQLDTILLVAKNRQESRQESAAAQTGEVDIEVTDPLPETEEPVAVQEGNADALVATVDPAGELLTGSGEETVSENIASADPIDDDPQPNRGDEEIYDNIKLTDESAYAAVLKDAGVAKEDVLSHSISSVTHTTYGVLYTIDFSTGSFAYHYRITEDGTMLAAGREIIENETESDKEVK